MKGFYDVTKQKGILNSKNSLQGVCFCSCEKKSQVNEINQVSSKNNN